MTSTRPSGTVGTKEKPNNDDAERSGDEGDLLTDSDSD